MTAPADIPRDEFGDELDNPAWWETVALLILFPFYWLWRKVVG